MKRASPPKNGTFKTILKGRKLLEKLAALEHEQWMEWSKTTAKRVDAETRARWRRYWVPYAKLSEKVKDQDRIWARKILQAVSRELQREEKAQRP
jgi:hypothetical protein